MNNFYFTKKSIPELINKYNVYDFLQGKIKIMKYSSCNKKRKAKLLLKK